MLKMILPILFLCLHTILALPREELCAMKVRSGKCKSSQIRRWYYNNEKEQCEPFVYGGCGGNANSFNTKDDCLGTCGQICKQPMYKGHCFARVSRYFFNQTSGVCEPFVYGGCGGNDNNFRNLQKCQTVCKNECTLPPATGLCRAMMARYYYNMETGNCEMFIYGGCSGNSNNFENKRDCEARCVIST